MQDEVTKHTLKLYHAMKNPERGFWAKSREVAVEILIITFAVTLSIWLHNWSDHRHEQKETAEFLKGLKTDLTGDIAVLEENKAVVARVDSSFTLLDRLIRSKVIDTMSENSLALAYSFDARTTHANIGRYEGFKSSGKLGTIENDSLKQAILVYYQQTIPGLIDDETYANTFPQKVLDLITNMKDQASFRDLSRTFKMRSLLSLGKQNLDPLINAYGEAQGQARKIISLIDSY